MKKNVGYWLVLCLMTSIYIALNVCDMGEVKAEGRNQTGYERPMLIINTVDKDENACVSTYNVKAADPYWKKFSSRYFYNQMNSQQKAFYDNLDTMCQSIINSSSDILETTNYGGEDFCLTPAVSYTNIPADEAIDLAFVFSAENPQYYFLANGVQATRNIQDTAGTIQLFVYQEFGSGTSRNISTTKFKTNVENYIIQVIDEDSEIAKEKKIHDILARDITYATHKYDQSSASVFLYDNDIKTVCAGYAEAFELLCNAVGIETIAITSYDHEWNKVKIDNRWYAVDATWDDVGAYAITTYFNQCDTKMEREASHIPEAYWSCYGMAIPVSGHIANSAPTITKPTETNQGYSTYTCSSCGAFYKSDYTDPIGKKPVYNGVDYSSVFDADFYANTYGDLKNAFGYDQDMLLNHFVNYGMNEGRQAISNFNVNSYRMRYADLRRAYAGYLPAYYQHYIRYGQREGRNGIGCDALCDAVVSYNGVNYSSVYDYNYYVKNNPDVFTAYGYDDMGVLMHFINYGMSEGRFAKQDFNVNSYKNRYADLRRAFGTDLKRYYLHYINYGKREKRETTGYNDLIIDANTVYQGLDYRDVYDFNAYVRFNKDVLNAFGYDENAVLDHFVRYGMNEGRIAKEQFNVHTYRMRYLDLQNAYGNNLKSYYLHYIMYGKDEKRIAQ